MKRAFGLFAAACSVLFLGACAVDGEADVGEARTAAERIRTGQAGADETRALADEAFEARLDPQRPHVQWGEVVDAALASGALDAARRDRAHAQAILVDWFGESEGTDPQGKPRPGFLLLGFRACVGPSSTLDYLAELVEASLDGAPLELRPAKARNFYYHVANASPGDTIQQIALPVGANGKTVRLHWHVRIFDAVTKQPLAPDWDHTEAFELPRRAAFLHGRRPRDPAP